jgi:DNA-binding CsgD family transcriptional regulator
VSLAAVEAYRASPRRWERARAREDAGVVVANRDRDAGARLLVDDAAYYHALGADADVRRVGSHLRSLGHRLPRSSSRPKATSGWDSLSPTELRVIELLSDGLTNRRIAESLFVSTRTVDAHVRHIFVKLGLSSRAAVTAEAVRRRERRAGTAPLDHVP